MLRKVTDEQILDAIRGFTGERGYPPTIEEIGSRVGLLSKGSTQKRLMRLRREGMIAYEDRLPRTIRVTP